MGTQRQILSRVLDAVRSQAHHLIRFPELTFPQLFNELSATPGGPSGMKEWLDASAEDSRDPGFGEPRRIPVARLT